MAAHTTLCKRLVDSSADLGTWRNVAALPKRPNPEDKSLAPQQEVAGEGAGDKEAGKAPNDEATTATLELTAERLITMLREGEEEEKEQEPAAEGCPGGEQEGAADMDASANSGEDMETDAAEKTAQEAEAAKAAAKWAAMGSVVTWNLRSAFLHRWRVCSALCAYTVLLTLFVLSVLLVLHCVSGAESLGDWVHLLIHSTFTCPRRLQREMSRPEHSVGVGGRR